MWYLFFEIWVWLILAFVLGWVAHWLLCCRGKTSHDQSSSPEGQTTTSAAQASDPIEVIAHSDSPVDDDWKPQGFSSQPDNADDLKRIKGVGSVIQETLNGLGIYRFEQIAEWNDHNIAWVENFLAFPGRIKREDWVSQAITLREGGDTEFSNRVDQGDVDYS